MIVSVVPDPVDNARGRIAWPDAAYPCRLGRNGVIAAADKREGDGRTPAGMYPPRRLLYRADRVDLPDLRLPSAAISPDDGWCDDPRDALYNRHIVRPFKASHERLWRSDGAYDLIVVLGHNDDPPVAGRGSAIFLHVAHDDGRATAGCIGLDRPALLALLARLGPDDRIEIALPG